VYCRRCTWEGQANESGVLNMPGSPESECGGGSGATNLCDFTVDGGAGDPQRRSGKTSAKLSQMPPLARRSFPFT
jgi:hypothetical protein